MYNVQLKTKSGFTLIELLVAVAIVSILSAIAVVMMGTVLKDSRDKQRMRNLNTIQQALELYRNDQHYYPASLTFSQPLIYGSKTYLSQFPQESRAGYQYVYQAKTASGGTCTGTDCLKYNLCAKSEGAGSGLSACGVTVNCKTSGTDYCNIGLSNL